MGVQDKQRGGIPTFTPPAVAGLFASIIRMSPPPPSAHGAANTSARIVLRPTVSPLASMLVSVCAMTVARRLCLKMWNC